MNTIDISAVAAYNSHAPMLKSNRFEEEKFRCLPDDSKLKERYGTSGARFITRVTDKFHIRSFTQRNTPISVLRARSHM
jgi:hypothetical protein